MKIRRQLIVDLTDKYKKEHKEEYKLICKDVKEQKFRAFDKKMGRIQGMPMKSDFVVPQTLFNWIDMAIDNPRFLSDCPEGNKEVKWFLDKYPEFKIASEH